MYVPPRRYNLPKQNETEKKNPYADVNFFFEGGRSGGEAAADTVKKFNLYDTPFAPELDEQHSEAIELKRLAGNRVFKTELYDTIILLYSKRP